MGILLHVVLEVLAPTFAPQLPSALGRPVQRMFAPLSRALRGPRGARVLGSVWLVSAGWMWLGFTLIPGAAGLLRTSAAMVSVFGPAVFAMWATVQWRHRNDRFGRTRRSAY